MKISIVGTIFLLFFSFSCKSEQKEFTKSIISENNSAKTNSGEWKSYLGVTNWKNANESCQRLGMRLPTRKELIDADKLTKDEVWKKDGDLFWAFDDYHNSNANNISFFFFSGVLNDDKQKRARCVN